MYTYHQYHACMIVQANSLIWMHGGLHIHSACLATDTFRDGQYKDKYTNNNLGFSSCLSMVIIVTIDTYM